MPSPTISTLLYFSWLLDAWIALPLPAAALSPDETCHLLDQTAFGAHPEMLADFAPLDRAAAVARLMAAPAGTPPRPAWADDRPFPDRALFAALPELEQLAATQAQNKQRAEHQRALQDGWMHWMLITEAPLVERMTLFWHNHSDACWADAQRGTLIKSPIASIVGTVRRFDLPDPNPRRRSPSAPK